MIAKMVLVACCSCLVTTHSFTQVPAKKNFRFQSINSVGILNGSNGTALGLQTVNGFAKKNWFAGIGIGLDHYQYRSIPLFADARVELGHKKVRLFGYTDAGINFSWVIDQSEDDNEHDFKNGIYYDTGIGLNASFKNGNAFVLSLGHSGKTTLVKRDYYNWNSRHWVTEENKYRLNRIVVKAGFRF